MSENSEKMLDIWFFVGLILLIYGLIVGLSGVYYLFAGPPDTALGNTNPCLWWGLVLIAGGLIFNAVSRHGRKREQSG